MSKRSRPFIRKLEQHTDERFASLDESVQGLKDAYRDRDLCKAMKMYERIQHQAGWITNNIGSIRSVEGCSDSDLIHMEKIWG